MVVDERIGHEAQNLVEDHQREQIGREGTPDGGGETGGEAGEEAGLRVLVQVPHVADGIDRCDDPKERGNGGKHHAERIDTEGEGDARQDLEQAEIKSTTRKHRGCHRDDDREHDDRGKRRDGVPDFVVLVQ